MAPVPPEVAVRFLPEEDETGKRKRRGARTQGTDDDKGDEAPEPQPTPGAATGHVAAEGDKTSGPDGDGPKASGSHTAQRAP